MDPHITEKTYPIELIWVFKYALGGLGVLVMFTIFMFLGARDTESIAYFIISLLYFPGLIAYSFLKRKTFTFALTEEFMTLGQGIISKQQRNIPYGVIQNVLVKQDLFDRMFGLAALIVENASQNGTMADGSTRVFGLKVTSRSKQMETAGFSGNRVTIPGLKMNSAQALKDAILQKLKEHPLHDNQSGL